MYLKTLTNVPKLPTIDQLLNYSTLAFPKWFQTKFYTQIYLLFVRLEKYFHTTYNFLWMS